MKKIMFSTLILSVLVLVGCNNDDEMTKMNINTKSSVGVLSTTDIDNISGDVCFLHNDAIMYYLD